MEYFCSDDVRSPDSYGLNSASYRNNERFQEVITEFIECASRWGWCNLSEYGSVRITVPSQGLSNAYSWFDSVFSCLRALDGQFLRAEKMAILHDRIAQFIDGETIPHLTDFNRFTWYIDDNHVTWSKFSPYENYTAKCFLDTEFRALFEAGHELACNIIVSVGVVSIVYRYLLGYVDRGGTKTYSPGSIEFRDTFVSLLLFRGAYVWIKFRDAYPPGVRRVRKRDEFNKVREGEYYIDRYESRLNPPNERDLHLGTYEKEEHAVLVRRIGLFYYGKDGRVVTLEDGSLYPIPEMSEQERSLCGEEKRKWVQQKANAVFKEIQEIQEKNKKIREENASRTPPSEDQVEARGCSSPADQSGIALLAPASANIPDAFSAELFRLAEKHGPLESGDGETPDYFTLEEIWEAPLPQEIVNEQLAEERQKYRRLEEKCSGLEEKYSGLKEEFSNLRQEVSELQQQQNKRLKAG